jgi:Tfp pilus assembly protein PilV
MQRFKKAFTLLEVIIALSLFEFVMVGVIVAVNRAYTYVQSTKIQVMAVNLAREGVERMYTIRDTNRRKHSAEKDKYWLITDPMTGNNKPPVMSTGVYVLNLKSTSNGQQYPSLSGIIPTRDDDNFYNNFDKYTGDQEIWRMQFTGDILQFSGNVPPNPP